MRRLGVDWLAEIIVKSLGKQGIVQEDDSDIYLFGLQIFIPLCLLIVSFLSIAVITGYVKETLLYLAIFFLFRTHCGGYHAPTQFRCYILSMLSYGLFLLCYHFIRGNLAFYLSVIMFLMANILVIILAPVDTENQRLTAKERMVFARKSRILLGIFDFVLIATFWYGLSEVAYIGVLAIIQVAASLAGGYIVNKKVREGGDTDEEGII